MQIVLNGLLFTYVVYYNITNSSACLYFYNKKIEKYRREILIKVLVKKLISLTGGKIVKKKKTGRIKKLRPPVCEIGCLKLETTCCCC